ncbi:MAG: YegS/Rv2252/BmrU family lipid kinase [Verrucomicrobia bacterium]|nr:YegS/Rv2252/BmrU family lipid kinase [Verrucomicrobiota bacterium]
MKTRFILNPSSGRNRLRPWLPGMIRNFIQVQGLEAELAVTEGPGHATALARAAIAAGCTQVVAVGGDGTMNEVAQALRHTPAELGLVPCGSGNGLALHLGLPLSLAQALALTASPTARVTTIDTGEANGKPFFNAMGIGLDAVVSDRFNRLTHRGLPVYARTVLGVIRELRPERVVISDGAAAEELEVLLVAVANSDQYGNHARIAPGARVDDGALDLVAIRPVGLVGAVSLAVRLFAGNLHRSPGVRRFRGDRLIIERVGPGLLHTDGETHAAGARIEVRVQPRSLRVRVPARSRVTTPSPDWAPAGFALQLP